MGERADKLRSETPSRTRRGWYGSEVWEVWDSDNNEATGNHNMSGLVNPLNFAANTFLPQYGDDGPILGTLYTDIRVTQVLANWSYLVLATYSSFGLYSGGPRPISQAYNTTRSIEIPLWNRFTDGVIVWWNKPRKRPTYPRMVMVRMETRFRPGDEVNEIQHAIAANAGTLWNIGGLLYRLSDRCSAAYDGHAFTRVNYAFERDCEIQAIPPDPDGWGNDYEIPYLPALYLWSERADTMSSANPPIVRAVPPPAFYGGPLNYPRLPGYPT